jgi:predicted dienelactone hydrolase
MVIFVPLDIKNRCFSPYSLVYVSFFLVLGDFATQIGDFIHATGLFMMWLRRLFLGLLVLACLLAGAMLITAMCPAKPVGFQTTQATGPDGKPFMNALWYPTSDRPLPTTLAGAALMSVAKDGAIAGDKLPLIVISHGNGAGPLAHVDLALASAGYVVAAPMHAGDNFLDQSALASPTFFNDRSAQFQATLAQVLGAWSGHGHIDPQRLGAYGFSMGGFTVLNAVGAQPDLRLIASHCAKDPEFACKVLEHGGSPYVKAAAPLAGSPFVAEPRLKAAVLAAPGMGFTFGEHALDQVQVPIQLWLAEKDDKVTFLGPLQSALHDKLEQHLVPGAGHLSFLAPCTGLLRPPAFCSDAGDFDRAAFHANMNAGVIKFFDQHLQHP